MSIKNDAHFFQILILRVILVRVKKAILGKKAKTNGFFLHFQKPFRHFIGLQTKFLCLEERIIFFRK